MKNNRKNIKLHNLQAMHTPTYFIKSFYKSGIFKILKNQVCALVTNVYRSKMLHNNYVLDAF